jgi:hypothetical protein
MAARRRSRQKWKQIVLEWQQSALRKDQYARRHGLNPTMLGFWCWTLKADLAAAPPRLQLLSVQTLPVAACGFPVARKPMWRNPSSYGAWTASRGYGRRRGSAEHRSVLGPRVGAAPGTV